MRVYLVEGEIHASEPQRLIDFYAALFGWNFTQFGDMPYLAIDTGDGAIGMDTPGRGIKGGLMQRKGPAPERGAPVTGALRQWHGERPSVATKGGHWRDGDDFPVD